MGDGKEGDVMLPRNVGSLDRVLRLTFGAILFLGGLLPNSRLLSAGARHARNKNQRQGIQKN